MVRWHRVGSEQSADREVFAVRDHPTRVPYGTVTEDGRYLVITLDEGTFTNGIVVMSLDGRPVVEPVFVQYDGVYAVPGLAKRSGHGTAVPDDGGRRERAACVAVDLGKPAPAQRARVVVPESDQCDGDGRAGRRQGHRGLPEGRACARCSCSTPASAQPLGAVKLPGLGAVAGFTGEPGDVGELLLLRGILDAAAGLPARHGQR